MDEILKKRIPRSLPILNVLDNVHPCSYLPDRTATLPLILPGRKIGLGEYDHMLDGGLRRSGYFTYFAACEGCVACEPSRLDVARFRWTSSWRRVLNRGDRCLAVQLASPECTEEKLRLFNAHRMQRGLGQDEENYQAHDYEGFLVDSCCEVTMELQVRLEDRIVAVSVIDFGQSSLSAVYTYFDPELDRLSLGTYAILKLIQLAERTKRRYVYLGMYVAENQHLNYKARFQPQERLVSGEWVSFGER